MPWQQGEKREGVKERGGKEGTGRSREEEEKEKKIDLGTEDILTSAQREKDGRVNRERGNGERRKCSNPNDGRYAATAAELPING